MTYQPNIYTGNGTNRLFTAAFPYLSESDVVVTIDDVVQTLNTDYVFLSSSQIETTVAPGDGVEVRIERVTNRDDTNAVIQPGSAIPSESLNGNFQQILYIAQEVISETSDAATVLGIAEGAQADAAQALAVANGIAGTANTALSDASAAVSTANAASATANGIASTANNALTQASTANSNATSAVSTANAAAATAAAAAQDVSLGLRNLIINGSMLVYQRGGSFNLAANTVAYTLDRWIGASVGGGANIQQVIVDRAARLRYTGGAGSTISSVNQRIESWDIAHLAGQQVTLSFDVSNTLRTDLVVSLTYPNVADNYTTFTAGPVANVTVNSTLTRYSVSFTLGAQAINGLQVTFTFSNQTSGSFDLARVQLEAGPLATPFEQRQHGLELMLCQRYYCEQQCDLQSAAVGAALTRYSFPTVMRSVPTAVNKAAGTFSSASVAQDFGSLSAEGFFFQILASGVNGFVIGRRQTFSAEL